MKLSIITVNKNNAKNLEKTIKSVICQTFTDFEYLIIDGSSTDGSVEIIRKYNSNINFWVSEPDTGIYNAMNKGIRKAKGEYCLFLNSGDLLIDNNTLLNLFEEVKDTISADIYYTDCIRTNNTYYKAPAILDINYLILKNLNHQNTIINRSLFFNHNFYSEKYCIAADYEFWLRELWVYKSTFIFLKTKIAIYDSSGISSTNNYDSEKKECIRSVFGSIGESLIKLQEYNHDIFLDIITVYGYSKFLDFILKTYRYILKRYKLIFKK